MKRLGIILLACAALGAQQIKLNLDHLASKATNTVDVSLNKSLLQMGAKFLSSKDPEEAKAKAVAEKLEGIYVKSFEFDREGMWSQADLDQVRNELKAPEWSRIVGVKSSAEKENAEIFVRSENGKVAGIVILATDLREFTVVNIVGNVDLESLAAMGGQFGIPKLRQSPPKKREE